ncbi:glutathione S-transferase [Halomonas sp. CnH100-B]|jgi:glutathione S-transferase|uniref:glutathione transferase n=1 Tax=Vreelandella aquamarina TaxID=77097 RepID=A0A857GGP8_9GAMM|nr:MULTISPECIES: glutathione S-transferase [Halomonas]MAO62222.1 glutathione S-transferase [Halomonas sp.]MCO7230603.1 glutathione S-transferase [Halomonas sp. CnH100-B]MDK9688715.1 glutathione S-transferase [Halomonas sp. LC1]MDP4559073.1 glutathione S-transferase [Halomonas meridiana]QHD48443.1 glutathione S-transferase [Halomonas meridiana]|tara:strand:- start:1862 stop:2533 length:672 start_codon:yes stop_codon:yes gene_type:complete
MIRVHHLEKSRSHRVLWLLESLNLDYEIEVYQRDSKTQQAPDALKKVHPLGKSPVITDGDLTIAESGAIIDYLVNRYGNGRLQPAADAGEEWVNYRYWLHYAEGSLMPLLVMGLVFNQVPKQSPWFIKPLAKGISDTVRKRFIQPQLTQHMDMMESHLATRGHFAGEWPSGADIQMSFPLQALKATQSLSEYPAIAAFVERVENDSAWQRVVERAGPLTMPGE